MQIAMRIVLAVAAIELSGCGTWGDNNLNLNGAQQVAINDDATRRVDLVRLIAYSSSLPDNGTGAENQLNPISKANSQHSAAVEPFSPTTDPKSMELGDCPLGEDTSANAPNDRRCLEKATQIFYSDPLYLERRRDAIQARLIAASRSECKQFTEHLNSIHNDGNMIAGLVTTGAAAAGAVVNSASAASNYAGTAAFASGARAEFNADYFLQQAVPIITKAIHSAQDNYLRDTILPNRRNSIDVYPLWDAIGDAFRFNTMCSLVAGLGQLDKSLQVADDPGMDAVARSLAKFNKSRKIMTDHLTDVDAVSDAGTDTSGNITGNSLAALSSSPNIGASAVIRAKSLLSEGLRKYSQQDGALITVGTTTSASLTKAQGDANTAAQTLIKTATSKIDDCLSTTVKKQLDAITSQLASGEMMSTDPITKKQALIKLAQLQNASAMTGESIVSYARSGADYLDSATQKLVVDKSPVTQNDAEAAYISAKAILATASSALDNVKNFCPAI